jgi:chromosomal replication initiator protein
LSEQLQLGDDERSAQLKKAWNRTLLALSPRVNKVTYESYIKPIRPAAYDGATVTLAVDNAFAREWLDKRYRELIQSELARHLEAPFSLVFRVMSLEDRPAETILTEVASSAPPPEPPKPASRIRPADIQVMPSMPLLHRYNFEDYVVGPSNRLAHAAAQAVAQNPGKVYNPLFLYGGSGLGKTHLLHAVGNLVSALHPHLNVLMVDGESFTHHFVTALRERKTEAFRRICRNVDVWLMDDIQFIAGKESTKEEFFHTFNALYQSGKQIIIASDQSPKDLRAIDERLRSRFECGLIADVATPNLETRLAIVQQRCRQERWNIPQPVLLYIATAIQSNMRALEGALTRLVAYSSIMGCEIDLPMAHQVLGEFFVQTPLAEADRKGIPIETILSAVATVFHTTVEALRSERRGRDLVDARQCAMLLLRELRHLSLAQIGEALGGRDHTTVQRGIAALAKKQTDDPELARRVKEAYGMLAY